MLDYLKRSAVLFFILFTFSFSNSAQTSEPTDDLPKAEETAPATAPEKKPVVFGEISKPFAKSFFEPENAPVSERLSQKSDDKTQETPQTQEAESWELRRGEKQIGFEIGYSPFQPTFFAEKEYNTEGRSFFAANVNWGRVFGTVKGVTVQYRLEIVPLALAFRNEVENPAYQSPLTTPEVPPTIRETTYGIGIAPLGLRFFFRPQKRLKPFASINGGIILFNKPMPVPETTNYSFTGDFGGGIQYQPKRNIAISFGYRYYHISNFNTTEINPGYNANIFYVGYSFFYK